MRLARLEAEVEDARPYGTRGQAQSGIDLYARLYDDSYSTYQCKRYEEVGASDLKTAVDKFLEGDWAERSSQFVFCTSYPLALTQLANAIEMERKRLAEREPSIRFVVWDADVLSEKLKALPNLVVDFFGQPWLDRFLPAQARGIEDDRLRAIEEGLEELRSRRSVRARVLTIDWAPERLRRALLELEERDNELFSRLTEQVDNPPHPRLLEATIDEPPQWARDADAAFWEVLARLAESTGRWDAASRAWEQVGARQDDFDTAGSLVAAGVAAHVGGSDSRRDALLADARELAPEHPRLVIQELSDDMAPGEQLERLGALESDEPDVVLLIAGRKALASLLLPDVEQAREHLAVAEQHGPGSAIVQAVGVNVVLQAARLDILAGRPLEAPALRAAHDDALRLRARLLSEHRYEESARLLMLAADALAMLDERDRAGRLLEQAQDAELKSPDGAVVLADAAERAAQFRLTLKLIEPADDSPAARRIRAGALEEVGSAAERIQALRMLDELVAADGPESAEAAFLRLAATPGGRRIEWSDAAAKYLREHDHERAAVMAEAFYLARWHGAFEQAEKLLEPHLDQMWAKLTRLRLAITRKYRPAIRAAADDLMAAGPPQGARVEAGRGYGLCRDFERAQEVLMTVARDPSAPPLVRAEAFRLLLDAVGNQLGNWDLAAQLHGEWVDVVPGDTRASVWGPRIANRLSQARGD